MTILNIVINTHFVPQYQHEYDNAADQLGRLIRELKSADPEDDDGESPVSSILFDPFDYPPELLSYRGSVGITRLRPIVEAIELSRGSEFNPVSRRFAPGPRPMVHAHLVWEITHRIPVLRGINPRTGRLVHGLNVPPIVPRMRDWFNSRWFLTAGVHVWIGIGDSRLPNYVSKDRGVIGRIRRGALF